MIRNRANYATVLGLLVIAFYAFISINSQLNYTFKPFLRLYKAIPSMLFKDDLNQLKELAYPIYRIVYDINIYPDDARFYFAPCFKDSKNTKIWWWYLHVMLRYLCYPRNIFCINPVVYNDDKAEYLKRFVSGAKKYNELDWLKARNVKYIILFRSNAIQILSLDNEIAL